MMPPDAAVPFEHLVAGDTVRIFWRDELYHEKVMIGGQGTSAQPIRVCGVPGPAGQRPVIDGGVVIRWNWIEDGAHVLDLVEIQEATDDLLPLPSYHETFVYGNVLLRTRPNGPSMVHYSGDSGQLETYRKGTLHFFANTIYIATAARRTW